MAEGKIVYIASPYAGDIENNIRFAKAACRLAMEEGSTPVAAHLLYPQMLDDSMAGGRSHVPMHGAGIYQFWKEAVSCIFTLTI